MGPIGGISGKKRVLLMQYGHESSTVNPFSTGMDRYGGREQLISGNPLADLGSFIADFRAAFAERNDVELVETVDAWANPWGRVEREVQETVKSIVRERVAAAGKIDGVLLMLHGAMVLEDDEDGEGDLLAFLRNLVGDGTPIFAVLDLHANITAKMIANADMLINCDTYPHIDLAERVREAAKLMLATLDGKAKPVMAARKLPLLAEFLPTTAGIGAEILEKVHELEKRDGILCASVAYGFFCADIRESGVCAVAVADASAETARHAADELAQTLWNSRDRMRGFHQSIDAILDDLEAHPEKFPAVIAEGSDNPGGGATGEGTRLLRALLDRGIDDILVAFIRDPAAVELAMRAGVGAEVELALGGHLCPAIDGEPFRCRAEVRAIIDPLPKQGRVAAFRYGRTYLLAQTGNGQTWDTRGIDACGLNVADFRVVAVKSAVHFRHAFTPLVKSVYVAAGPGLAPQELRLVDRRHCRRPIYPLDPEAFPPERGGLPEYYD